MKNLTDQIYIEQLRQRLWTNRDTGRAAVMVGAGFSRNAEAVTPSAPPFPLWNELTRAMTADLYPSTTGGNGQTNKDPLRLATEYESVFERDALNSLIARAIPDANYKPSLLHRMLLSLPWSDVFTTNYDTLLERTLPEIHDRRYDLVLTPADLPARVKPRIVKLHGSFPSHLPFIITQEDFRSYPREFAPFVNTVQQSIVENAFCLLGFSGEDPNFLYWTGWVRDNFGKSSPPIYLCSLFEISLSERRVLEKRNVFPIDLSAVISKSEIPDDNLRYSKILEWFLLELWNGAPLDNLNFPKLNKQNRWTPGHGVPAPSSGGLQENDLGSTAPNGAGNNLTEEQLNELKFRWKSQREAYPGWTVLPKSNRDELWRYTEYWIDPILRSLDQLTAPNDLSLIHELNWRLERCLLPLPEVATGEVCQQIASRYNPYPSLLDNNAAFQPNNDAGRNFGWSEISEQWTVLIFALMREAREQFDDGRFQEYVELLREIVKQKEDWQARWFYERCLFALFRHDHEQARDVLSEWNKNLGGAFWKVKRAAILAEIGEIDSAGELAEAALSEIRSRQLPFANNYTLFSQEGWTMLLLKGIKSNRFWVKDQSLSEYSDRWERLANYRCNPWADLEYFELAVKSLDPRPKPAKRVAKGFSSESETVTYSFMSSSETEKARLSLSFLRMFDEAAIPFRANRMVYFAEAVANAAVCLASSASEQTINTIVRTEHTGDIDNWFNRHHVAGLSEISVRKFYVLFTNSFVKAVRRFEMSLGTDAGETAMRRIQLFAELLSRLCFRLPKEQLDTVFSYALQIYKLPVFTQNLWLHESVNILFQRVLEVLTPTETLNKITALLELPIPGEGGFDVAELQKWSEPFDWIHWTNGFRLPDGFDRTEWNALIENLLRIVKSGQKQARERAVSRLEKLYQIKALTNDETDEFARAIWSRTNPVTHLPKDTNVADWGFLLSLPNTDLQATKTLLRSRLTSQDFSRVVQHNTDENGAQSVSIGIGTGRNLFIENVTTVTFKPYYRGEQREKLIDWTTEEIQNFLVKAVAWWNDEKSSLTDFSSKQDFMSDSIRKQFLQLADFFAVVVLPRAANLDSSAKNILKEVLDEMQEQDVYPLSALPSRLYLAPEESDRVASKILASLRSADGETVAYAAAGTRNWLFYAEKSDLTIYPSKLLDELVRSLASRRQPGLKPVLRAVFWIVEILPETIKDGHLEDLLMGLEFLKTEAFPLALDVQAENTHQRLVEDEDQVVLQGLAVQLAKALKTLYETRKMTIPNVLDFWSSRS